MWNYVLYRKRTFIFVILQSSYLFYVTLYAVGNLNTSFLILEHDSKTPKKIVVQKSAVAVCFTNSICSCWHERKWKMCWRKVSYIPSLYLQKHYSPCSVFCINNHMIIAISFIMETIANSIKVVLNHFRNTTNCCENYVYNASVEECVG